jgi:hypothetical protein
MTDKYIHWMLYKRVSGSNLGKQTHYSRTVHVFPHFFRQMVVVAYEHSFPPCTFKIIIIIIVFNVTGLQEFIERSLVKLTEIAAFLHILSCSFVHVYRRFSGHYYLHYRNDDGDSKALLKRKNSASLQGAMSQKTLIF